MVRNTITLSVSIPIQQSEWIDKRNMSASELLQDAIKEKQRLWESYNTEIEQIKGNVKILQRMIEERGDYLSDKGLESDFIEWRKLKGGIEVNA